MAPLNRLEFPGCPLIYHRGPGFEQGPLPTVIYFALSGAESLTLQPYCQPIEALDLTQVRACALSLPDHPEGGQHHQAISLWAEKLAADPNYLEEFLNGACRAIDALIVNHLAVPGKLVACGLSRGGWVATQLAAQHRAISIILGFSPLTSLEPLTEFSSLPKETLQATCLEGKLPRLAHKTLRYYIGNRDLRVSTASCFNFVQALAEASFQSGRRSPPIELLLFPSIGRYGHGTPPSIFHAGAHWLMKEWHTSGSARDCRR